MKGKIRKKRKKTLNSQGFQNDKGVTLETIYIEWMSTKSRGTPNVFNLFSDKVFRFLHQASSGTDCSSLFFSLFVFCISVNSMDYRISR